MSDFISIPQALDVLREGRMIILVDDDRREQEGDFVIAADYVTAETINLMTRYARAGVWLTLSPDIVDRLHIPAMPERQKHVNQAPFLASIEARHGVSSGASAEDRVHTIRTAIHPRSTAEDISMPGHVFPLRAAQGGVFERPGHTEGSVDLARLAGLQPAALIGEIMKDNGSMARLPELKSLSQQYDIPLVSINDLIAYRMQHETLIEEVASSELPLANASMGTIKVFRERYQGDEHVALLQGPISSEEPILVRLHSECLTGDVLGSTRCDCGWQLQHALQRLQTEGGLLLYMRQEGRGIGLSNKIKSYHLQAQGLDTVEANHQLGFSADHRHYGVSAQILQALGIKRIRLMTNNPRKLEDLHALGIEVVERIPLEMQPTDHNRHYLEVKRNKLGHLLSFV